MSDAISSESNAKASAISPMQFLILGAVAAIAAAVIATLTANFDADEASVGVLIALYGTVALASVIALACIIVGSIRIAVGEENASNSDDELLVKIHELKEAVLVSETAKRIAFRKEDLELIHNTIQLDIDKHDYDAAISLVDELAEVYGYKEDAESYRDKIDQARMAEIDEKVDQAIAKLDEVLATRDFASASREAAKIQRLYPDKAKATQALYRVEKARDQYKHELIRSFLSAAERDEIDAAVELLRELDLYLHEDEAAQYQEIARGVIGKMRDNLGVQFKIAVHDREWTRAVNVGEQIIAEFPNTRMADEVRQNLDLLRERAAGQIAAQRHQSGD